MRQKRGLPLDTARTTLLEVCVRGTAFSARAKGAKGKAKLGAWRAAVESAARLELGGVDPLSGDLELRICEFSAFTFRDRDNVAKPIQDALQGVVYVNDQQIKLCHSEWCDIDGVFRVRYISAKVAEAMIDGRDFVWLRVFAHEPRRTLA